MTTRVRLLWVGANNPVVQPGDVIEMEDERAERFIATGHGESADASPESASLESGEVAERPEGIPETTAASPAPETTADRTGRPAPAAAAAGRKAKP